MEDFYDPEQESKVEQDESPMDNGALPDSGTKDRKKSAPPFSDGSEEFFEQFTPREERQRLSYGQRNFLVGLGVALGVLAGVGVTLFLLKDRRKKSWWRRLLGR